MSHEFVAFFRLKPVLIIKFLLTSVGNFLSCDSLPQKEPQEVNVALLFSPQHQGANADSPDHHLPGGATSPRGGAGGGGDEASHEFLT